MSLDKLLRVQVCLHIGLHSQPRGPSGSPKGRVVGEQSDRAERG